MRSDAAANRAAPKRGAAVATVVALLCLIQASSARAITGDHPWLIVRCRPDNIPAVRFTTDYYKQMFTSAGAGTGNMADWFHDISFGQLSIAGTVVADGAHADSNGFYVEPETEDQVGLLSRGTQVQLCASEAAQDYDLNSFYGVVALYPSLETTTTASITAQQTTIPIAASPTSPTPGATSQTEFPTPPFTVTISGSGGTETVTVTAVNGNQLTVKRGQNYYPATPPATGYVANAPEAFSAGATVTTPNDSYGAASIGQVPVPITGSTILGHSPYNLALVNLPLDINETGAAHEMGHGFGLEHSRRLSTPTAGYNDGYDVMSAFAGTFSSTDPTGAHNVAFGGSNLNSADASKGPGLDAIQLDNLGVIPSNRILAPDLRNQLTVPLHSLTDPDALSDSSPMSSSGISDGYLQLNIPDSLRIPFLAAVPATATTPAAAGVNCASDDYVLEYREATGAWDAGIPQENQAWDPADSALNGEISNADFPDGSVILTLRCYEDDAISDDMNYGYDWLVNTAPEPGAGISHNSGLYTGASNAGSAGSFWPGDGFADTINHFYFAVDKDLRHPREAIITISPSVIKDALVGAGPSSGFEGSSVTLTAQLVARTPEASSRPYAADAVLPGELVSFQLGSQSCGAETDLNGQASCSLIVQGPLGKRELKVSTGNTRALTSASAKSSFNVLPALAHRILKPRLRKVRIHRSAPTKLVIGQGV